jgi:hypothetical protein
MEDLQAQQPCSHEKADTRVFLHVRHCGKNCFRKVSIRTVDTDVLVLAIAIFHRLELNEVWVAFGTGNKCCYIAAHEIAQSLGPLTSKVLLMFHAITRDY